MAVVEGVRPTASYRAIELGAGAFEIGLVAGAFAALAFLAALPIGRAIDRLGERRFFIVGAALLIAAAVIGLSVPMLAALVVMQALLGLGQICLSVSAQTAAGNTTGSRDLRFARLSVAVAGGHFLGPLIAGTVIEARDLPVLGGGTLAFLTLATATAVVVLLLASIARSSPVDRGGGQGVAPPVPVRELLRIDGMPQALYVGIVSLTTFDLFVAYLPVLGEERGIPPSVVGYLLATRAAMTIASRLSMGVLLRRLGRRGLLRSTMLVGAVAVSGLALPVAPVWSLFGLMAVAGFAIGVSMPMTTAWVAERAPTGTRGAALGLRVTGNRISQVVVPVSLGGAAAAFGAGAIFAVAGTAFLLGWRLVRTAPLEEPD